MQKTIFITGTDYGLGFSLVKKYLDVGFRVFAGVFQFKDDLDQLAKVNPEKLCLIPLDVTGLDSVRQAAALVSQQTPSLDLLINNAGICPKESLKPLDELDLENGQLEQVMEVNAFGALRVTQQFLPLLENGSKKLILNISSEAGSIGDCTRESWFAYCMSKAALNMQCKLLQNWLKPRGFKILAIHPGWMRSHMGSPEADFHPDQSAEAVYQLASKNWEPGSPIYIDYQGKPMDW
jgi:NAD(P)-dependent dehydrogenase (short-subunit alcohol dehydrogenase family)